MDNHYKNKMIYELDWMNFHLNKLNNSKNNQNICIF